MKRNSEAGEDREGAKRFKTDNNRLLKLDAASVNVFIKTLKRKACDDWPSVAAAFDGRIPSCMFDYAAPEATRMIAYEVDKYIDNDDRSNEEIITIDKMRQIKIAEYMRSAKVSEEKATKLAFPLSTAKLRGEERMIYLQEAQAVITLAESRMTSDIVNKLNADKEYRQLKQERCVIGWLKKLRAKAINASNSAELARKQIEKQIEELQMGDKTDSYYSFKSKFMTLIADLKNISNYQMDERHFINAFVVKLDEKLFPNLFYEFRSGRYKDTPTLRKMYEVTDSIHADTVMVREQYEEMFRSKARKNNNNNNNSEHSVNLNESEAQPRWRGICKFYKSGIENSCRRHNCRYIHAEEADAKLIAELEENKQKLLENIAAKSK